MEVSFFLFDPRHEGFFIVWLEEPFQSAGAQPRRRSSAGWSPLDEASVRLQGFCPDVFGPGEWHPAGWLNPLKVDIPNSSDDLASSFPRFS